MIIFNLYYRRYQTSVCVDIDIVDIVDIDTVLTSVNLTKNDSKFNIVSISSISSISTSIQILDMYGFDGTQFMSLTWAENLFVKALVFVERNFATTFSAAPQSKKKQSLNEWSLSKS